MEVSLASTCAGVTTFWLVLSQQLGRIFVTREVVKDGGSDDGAEESIEALESCREFEGNPQGSAFSNLWPSMDERGTRGSIYTNDLVPPGAGEPTPSPGRPQRGGLPQERFSVPNDPPKSADP